MIPVCISDDRAAAMERNRRTLVMYVSLPNYRNYWKEAGYVEEMEAIEKAVARGDSDALTGLMSDRWLADVTLFGSADEVREASRPGARPGSRRRSWCRRPRTATRWTHSRSSSRPSRRAEEQQ